MRYLLPQYKESLQQVQALKRKLAEGRTIKTYRIKKGKKKRELASVERQPITDPETLLTGIVDSLTYAIDYMETGRVPGSRRGAYSGVRKEIVMDPYSYRFLVLREKAAPPKPLSLDQVNYLTDLLAILTYRERDVFLQVRGQGLSFGEVAGLLKVTKGTVQTWVERAEQKLRNAANNQKERGVQTTMFAEM